MFLYAVRMPDTRSFGYDFIIYVLYLAIGLALLSGGPVSVTSVLTRAVY